MSEILLETRNLQKFYPIQGGAVHAVDGVNVQIRCGDTLGVVGESGCGKTTLGRTVLRLIEATGGEIFFDGRDILKIGKSDLRELRKSMQIIFQDPYASLNPRMSVAETIQEPIIFNRLLSGKEAIQARVAELMDVVGIAQRYAGSYPHELDGGRRQRIGIARALALNPRFIVCDEPVSALDVSIRAQILNLLMDLQEELKLTYMFITHDLSVVKHISNHIAVMYMGQVIERAPSDVLFEQPVHPYTQTLLSAIPLPTIGARRQREIVKGEVSTPVNPQPGCRFAPRCPGSTGGCLGADIPLVEIEPDHWVACRKASLRPSLEDRVS